MSAAPGYPYSGARGLYVVTSTFTLAKVVRDHQEANSVHGRIDQARVEKLLSEHDPYRMAGT